MFSKSTASYPYTNKNFSKFSVPEPVIPLTIITPTVGKLDIKFLVDTGADITILPINPYAALFEFIPNEQESIKVQGIARSTDAYPYTLKIELSGKQIALRAYFAPVKTIPLLGRLDFWEHYSLLFDNHKQCLQITALKTNNR